MNINFLLLFCALSLFNVIIQIIKSLCTIKSSTFISACVNAAAYGVYTYVIVFTNSEGLPLYGKALITAISNFIGVYIANSIFNKCFAKEVNWIINISIPVKEKINFEYKMEKNNIVYHCYGANSDRKFVLYDIYSPNKKYSKIIKNIIPEGSQYNISENTKRL